MKYFRTLVAITLISTLLVTSIFAVENAKKANFNNNPAPSGFNLFHPTTGYMMGYYDSESDFMSTVVSFKYTSAAISNINTYNSQQKYTGVDVKDEGNGFHAYSIATTVPNVKTDIEPNANHDYYNEAEIVILGSLSANKNYTMSVTWQDNRRGIASNSFVAMAELSNKPSYPGGDYNVVKGGWVGLATLYYGKIKGYP